MSPLQQRILAAIRDDIDVTGTAPTLSELCETVGVSSKGRLHQTISELVRQGKLIRTKAQTRNLALPDHIDLSIVPTSVIRAELARREAPQRAPVARRVCETAPCGYDACGERVEKGHFMCRERWLALPRGLRLEIFRARDDGHRGTLQAAWTRAIVLLEQWDRA